MLKIDSKEARVNMGNNVIIWEKNKGGTGSHSWQLNPSAVYTLSMHTTCGEHPVEPVLEGHPGWQGQSLQIGRRSWKSRWWEAQVACGVEMGEKSVHLREEHMVLHQGR